MAAGPCTSHLVGSTHITTHHNSARPTRQCPANRRFGGRRDHHLKAPDGTNVAHPPPELGLHRDHVHRHRRNQRRVVGPDPVRGGGGAREGLKVNALSQQSQPANATVARQVATPTIHTHAQTQYLRKAMADATLSSGGRSMAKSRAPLVVARSSPLPPATNENQNVDPTPAMNQRMQAKHVTFVHAKQDTGKRQFRVALRLLPKEKSNLRCSGRRPCRH